MINVLRFILWGIGMLILAILLPFKMLFDFVADFVLSK